MKLKKEFPHLKWVADLRDPWTDIYYYKELLHTNWAKKKDLALRAIKGMFIFQIGTYI